MNAKLWTIFVVVFVSLDSARATFIHPRQHHRRHHRDHGYSNFENWPTCNDELRNWLDTHLGKIRPKFDNRCPLENRDIEGYQLKNVYGKGFNKFALGDPCHYKRRKGGALIHISLSFNEIRAYFELFSPKSYGFGFGDFGRAINRYFHGFTHDDLKIVFPYLLVNCVLDVEFHEKGAVVKDFWFDREGLNEGEIKSESFIPHANVFEPFFRNACGYVIESFFGVRFRQTFELAIEHWAVFPEYLFPHVGNKGSSVDKSDEESNDEDGSLGGLGPKSGGLGKRNDRSRRHRGKHPKLGESEDGNDNLEGKTGKHSKHGGLRSGEDKSKRRHGHSKLGGHGGEEHESGGRRRGLRKLDGYKGGKDESEGRRGGLRKLDGYKGGKDESEGRRRGYRKLGGYEDGKDGSEERHRQRKSELSGSEDEEVEEYESEGGSESGEGSEDEEEYTSGDRSSKVSSSYSTSGEESEEDYVYETSEETYSSEE